MTALASHPVAADRQQRRIYRDGRIDVWLIGWRPGQATELHDHGGSPGWFVVVTGALTEAVLQPAEGLHDRLCEHQRRPGETLRFGERYVHSLRNTSDGPAVSLHVYSRPLARMNYYDLQAGFLVRIASVAVDDPERMPCVR